MLMKSEGSVNKFLLDCAFSFQYILLRCTHLAQIRRVI